MTLTRWRAAATALSVLALFSPAGAFGAPVVTTAFAPQAYTLGAACDGKPVLFVHAVLVNHGGTPSAPVRLTANDAAHTLEGHLTLLQLSPGVSTGAVVPLQHVAGSPAALAGAHTLTVTTLVGSTASSMPLDVTIPATLCGSPPAPATPGPATPASSTTAPLVVRRAPLAAVVATPQPTPIAVKHIAIGAVALGVPANVRAANGGQDCALHVGTLGALVCPDMIASGDVLLVWDWQPAMGPSDIDGFRIYRVDSNLKQLVYTRANKKDLTLADIAKPAGGYSGKCYAVSAFSGTRESALSPAFCAGAGSAAKTVSLAATQVRSSRRDNKDHGNGFTGGYPIDAYSSYLVAGTVSAGFVYFSEKHTLGDTFLNIIQRAAVAFDVSGLRNAHLVSAKLHLNLVDSRGAGNNHSCITAVGAGTEFWWRNTSWIEGQFGLNIAPTDTGPDITANVTQLVAPWLRGEPNYGFVLINGDENLGAFTNKGCMSGYSDPRLEITYY